MQHERTDSVGATQDAVSIGVFAELSALGNESEYAHMYYTHSYSHLS